MVNEKYKKILLAIVHKHAPQARVILFGSRATHQHTPGSDIDLALDAGSTLPPRVLGFIRDDIQISNVPYFVDVVDVHDVDEKIKQAILRDGVEWTD